MQSHDELVSIVLDHLRRGETPAQTEKELIHDIVAEYMCVLMMRGNIPHFLLDTLELDLNEEVLEIYRKFTYGFTSLRAYRLNFDIITESEEPSANTSTTSSSSEEDAE